MTAKDSATRWRVGTCALLTMFAAAFTSGISAQHYADPTAQLGDYLGNFAAGLLLYSAPGLIAAALFRSARAGAYVATSGLVALVLISGAIATKTPYFLELIGRRDTASEPAPDTGPWTQYAKAPAATTSKPANYFDRFDKPATVPPVSANDGLPAGYKLMEPAQAPAPAAIGQIDPEWEGAMRAFLSANCEFNDPGNAVLMQDRLQAYKVANPSANDLALIVPAATDARALPGFRAGAGCGPGATGASSAAPGSSDPAWDAASARLFASNCEFYEPGNLQLLQEQINKVAASNPTASNDWLLGTAAGAARRDSRFKALSACPSVPAAQGAAAAPAGNVVVAYDGTAEAAMPKKPVCEYGATMTDEEIRRCQQ